MPESLEALERWMQAVITDPAGPKSGAAGAEARSVLAAELPEVFLPSAALSSAERVGIYAEMYFLRLLEVLEDEFPALRALLGSETTTELLRAYLVAHPSRHYSLNQLGAELADFLRAEAGEVAARAFTAELARLERTLQEVFDAPESASLGADAIAAVPPERWAAARLVPIPALVLHAFEFPTNAWYQAFRDGQTRAAPAQSPSWVAVYRREGRAWRMDLSRAQHALLGALVEGRTLAEALAQLAALPGIALEELAPRLQDWFREWAGEGFFARVEG